MPTDPPALPPDPPIVPPSAGRWYRAWRWGRYVLGLGLGGLALWLVLGKTNELSGASHYFARLAWGWMVVAAVAEALSYLAFAELQRRLLKAGGTAVAVRPMTGVTLAGNAMQNSLPAGLVLAAAYAFRQYRRFGADEVLSGWTITAATAVSFVCLATLAAGGLTLAFGLGSALDLTASILGIAAVAALLVVGWARRSAIISHAGTCVKISQKVTRRPQGDPAEVASRLLERVRRISPRGPDWAWALTMGMCNWLADMACLCVAFLCVGAAVPWQGLLLAYAAAQLAANLPITPGGLGVVEGSLTVALVAFGGGQDSTVAAVLIYRLFNFWIMLPVGWASWGVLALAGRRRRAAALCPPQTPGLQDRPAREQASSESSPAPAAGWQTQGEDQQ